jgi:hypothetical protein
MGSRGHVDQGADRGAVVYQYLLCVLRGNAAADALGICGEDGGEYLEYEAVDMGGHGVSR